MGVPFLANNGNYVNSVIIDVVVEGIPGKVNTEVSDYECGNGMKFLLAEYVDAIEDTHTELNKQQRKVLHRAGLLTRCMLVLLNALETRDVLCNLLEEKSVFTDIPGFETSPTSGIEAYKVRHMQIDAMVLAEVIIKTLTTTSPGVFTVLARFHDGKLIDNELALWVPSIRKFSRKYRVIAKGETGRTEYNTWLVASFPVDPELICKAVERQAKSISCVHSLQEK